MDLSSIVDFALSDPHGAFFTTLLPIEQGNTERSKKRHLTSEVGTDRVYEQYFTTYSAFMVIQLNFYCKLREIIDAVAPVK